jgi:hypothetical protein
MSDATLLRYYRRLYRRPVTVVKRTVSIEPDVWASVEQLARSQELGVSTVINRLLRRELVIERGLTAVQAWENEHGALTEAELAEADRILDGLGVGAGRRTGRKQAPRRGR